MVYRSYKKGESERGEIIMDAAIAALIGAGIAGSISVCAFLVNYFITRMNLDHVSAREFAKIALELKTQQLSELYGPLMALVEQDRRLAQKLREGKGDPEEWKLLDNLPEVLENPQDKAIVERIMEIDAKIEELIINKMGLVRTPGPPESFDLFLGHYKALTLAMAGEERPNIAEFEYYPRKLNEDIKEAYEAIQREREDILRRYEHRSSR